MTDYRLAPPCAADAATLAGSVREDEARELRLLYGLEVAEALSLSLREAGRFGGLFYALHGHGGVLGFGGARPFDVLGTAACPWFIGVDMTPHKRFLARYSRRITAHLLRRFPVLVNVVGDWNAQTLAWLPHAGFSVSDTPQAIYPGGPQVYRFWAAREPLKE